MGRAAKLLLAAWICILLERFGSELGWAPAQLWDPMALVGTFLIGISSIYVFSKVESDTSARRILASAFGLLALWSVSDCVDDFAWAQQVPLLAKGNLLHVVVENMLWTASGVIMVLAFYRAIIQGELSRLQIIQRREHLARYVAQLQRTEEALQESEARYRALVELSPVAIIVQLGGAMEYVNAAVLQLLGLEDRPQAIGKSIVDFSSPDSRDSLAAYIEQIETQGGHLDPIEAAFQNAAGDNIHVEVGGACVLYEGKVGVQLSVQDITRRKELEEKLRELAQRDRLTGIPNRGAFDETLASEFRRAMRNQCPLSLIMIDIDLFKRLNDSHGHLAGDACLIKVADALRASLNRGGDFVARYGGEEFVVLLPDIPEEGALAVAERLRAAVEQLKIENGQSTAAGVTTISLGVAVMNGREALTPVELIDRADRALYEAKRLGRNRVQRYSGS
jgi:diguanylate cyclase (GGDEF)-like protein/PAS domain S-box-containing protein